MELVEEFKIIQTELSDFYEKLDKLKGHCSSIHDLLDDALESLKSTKKNESSEDHSLDFVGIKQRFEERIDDLVKKKDSDACWFILKIQRFIKILMVIGNKLKTLQRNFMLIVLNLTKSLLFDGLVLV